MTNLEKTTNRKATSFLTAVWAIIWKDLQIEKHTRQTLSSTIMFSLVIVIMFNFALEANLDAARNISTGLLWATILLAGTLGLNRAFTLEKEGQAIDALLIAPIDRRVVYAAKVTSVTIFTLILELVLVFIFTIFFNKPFWQPPVLFILFLGTIGYVAAGVLVTSMTMQSRAQELLLPILLLPIILPLILPAAIAVAEYMSAQPEMPRVQSAVSLLLAYDLLILAVGFLVYHFIIES